MQNNIKSYSTYINEYWTTIAPGTVVIPGGWAKSGARSHNYKEVNTPLPKVVDTMYEDSEFDSIIEEMKLDLELIEKIKGSEDPLEILDIIKKTVQLKRSK